MDVKNGHGFHEGCSCEKCSQRFLNLFVRIPTLNYFYPQKRGEENAQRIQ